MPPVVAGAAISAGAGLFGGLLQSGANKNAQRSQERATNQAIALERERDARAERQYQAEVAAYTQRYEADQAMRREVLRRHGYNVPEPRKPGDPKAGPAPGGAKPAEGGTLAQLLSARAGMGPPGPGAGLGPNGSSFMMDSQGGPVTGGPAPGPAPTPMPNGTQLPPMMEGGTLGDLSGWSNWKRGI